MLLILAECYRYARSVSTSRVLFHYSQITSVKEEILTLKGKKKQRSKYSILGVKGLGDREQMNYAYKAEKSRRTYEAVMLKHHLNKSPRFYH